MPMVNVQEALDEQPVRAPVIRVLLICTLIMVVDGFDIFMVGAIAPAIAADFGRAPAAMALVFLLQQIGIATGAVVMGPVSDRFGRKNVLAICTLLFSIAMMAAALAQSLLQLAVLRGIAGVFLAGIFPVATTIISEFTPRRLRSRFVSILLAGYVAGSAGGGAVAAYLVGDYGWRISFWLGALVPLACIPLLLAFVPESLQFRARKNPLDPGIGTTLRQFAPSVVVEPGTRFIAEANVRESRPARIMDAVGEGRLLPSFVLWGAFLLAMGNGALISSWMPTYFHSMAGVPIQQFGKLLMFGSIAAVVATITVGILMDRYSPIRVLVIGYGLDAFALALMGFVPFGSPTFVTAFFIMKFCTYAGTVGLMVIASAYYPPSARATGFGWSVAAGRFGSILLPTAGGIALSSHLTIEQASIMMALPALLVVVLISIFWRLSARSRAAAG